jgi:hypothetical protein
VSKKTLRRSIIFPKCGKGSTGTSIDGRDPSKSSSPCLKSLNAALLALTPAMAGSRLILKNGARGAYEAKCG